MGSLNLLEALKTINKNCIVVMVTTDKYIKRMKRISFKENDPLGGDDPHSASKASCEIAIQSWWRVS